MTRYLRYARLVPFFLFCAPFVAVGFVAGVLCISAGRAVCKGWDLADDFVEWL